MTPKILIPALAAFWLAACSSVPVGSASPMSDEALAARFRACVSPTGPTTQLPLLPAGAESGYTGQVLPLSTTGRVADGYNHVLQLDAARSRGIIVQTGGIAGRRTLYGPFDLSAGCRISAVSFVGKA